MRAAEYFTNRPNMLNQMESVRKRLFILWLAAKDWLGKVLLGSLSLYYLPLRVSLWCEVNLGCINRCDKGQVLFSLLNDNMIKWCSIFY